MKPKPKQIQIDESLFYDILRYYVLREDGEPIPEDLDERVYWGLSKKLDSKMARDTYTKYKTAGTAEEREEARKKYLDDKGIPDKFRW